MSTAKLLLIENTSAKKVSCSQTLRTQPYAIAAFRSVRKALESGTSSAPDLVVVNAASLQTSGKRMCREIRSTFPTARILLITCSETAAPRPDSADVVLIPPFTPRKLINRIRRLLPLKAESWLHAGPIRLNIEHRRARSEGREAHLTPMQTKLLQVFLRHPDTLLTREYLMKQVWGTDYTGDTRTLDVHMSWLRRALDHGSARAPLFKTVKGKGYLYVTGERRLGRVLDYIPDGAETKDAGPADADSAASDLQPRIESLFADLEPEEPWRGTEPGPLAAHGVGELAPTVQSRISALFSDEAAVEAAPATPKGLAAQPDSAGSGGWRRLRDTPERSGTMAERTHKRRARRFAAADAGLPQENFIQDDDRDGEILIPPASARSSHTLLHSGKGYRFSVSVTAAAGEIVQVVILNPGGESHRYRFGSEPRETVLSVVKREALVSITTNRRLITYDGKVGKAEQREL